MHRSICLAMAMLWASSAARAQDGLAAQWATLWSAKKLDAVMQLYAPDPTFLPTIGPRWEGAAEIRKNFAGILSQYDPHISLRNVRSASSGNLGYESGVYDETITPSKRGKPILSRGSYLFLFERQGDGSWKILEQTWTSEAPPPNL